MSEGPSSTRPAGRRVLRNSGLRALTEVLGKLAAFVLFAAIAQRLGSSVLGDYTFAAAVAAIVYVLADFGSDRLLLREVALDHGFVDRALYDVVGLKVVAGLAGVVVTTAGVALLGYSSTVQALVLVLGLSFVFYLVGSTATAVFQAFERTEFYLYSVLPTRLLNALVGLAALALGAGIVAIAGIALGAAAIGAVLAWALMLWRFRRPSGTISVRRWAALARTRTPFGVQEVLGQLLIRFDIVLLSFFVTSAAVGWYGASYRLIEALFFVIWAVASSAMPVFSYLGPATKPALGRVFGDSLRLVTAVIAPVSVFLLVCAPAIVDLAYGSGFERSVPVLQWLAMSLTAYALADLSGSLLLARHRGRSVMMATAGAVALNIALCLVLIPILSIEGAAIATLASYCALAGAMLVLAARVAPGARIARGLAPPLVACVAMAAALAPVRDQLELAVPVGAAAYLAVLAPLALGRLRRDVATFGGLRRGIRSRAPREETGLAGVPEAGS